MTTYLIYMISPLIIACVACVFTRRYVNKDERTKRIFLVLFGITMTLMVGLRHPEVGSGDTMVYLRNWEFMSRVPLSGLSVAMRYIDFEKGYLAFVWLFSHIFFKEPQMLLIISGAFFALTICMFVKRNCKDVVLAALVFNCLGVFNFMVQGLRQSMAMCICLWAIEYCKKRNLKAFLLLVLLAASFHASAVVFIPVYWIYKLKLNLKYFFVFVALSIIGVLIMPNLFEAMNTFINDDYGLTARAETGGVVAVMIYAVIIIFGYVFSQNKGQNYAAFLYMCIVGAIAMIMRNTVNTIVERISFYFAFSQMVIMSNSIMELQKKRLKTVIKCIAILLCVGVAIHKASYSVLIPYTFFWQT